MTPLVLRSHSARETARIGSALGQYAEAGDVFLLSGELGAGKTCLTQGVAKGLGVDGYVRSPTFVLVSVHQGRLPLYHIDIYRLDEVAEVVDLGLEEYLAGDGVSVIEWASKALEVFPQPYMLVTLTYEGENERLIQLEAMGERYESLLSQVEKRLSRTAAYRRRS
jgi:tRNA threonylcarbamoyladenosine biosynthesis protein TsaE